MQESDGLLMIITTLHLKRFLMKKAKTQIVLMATVLLKLFMMIIEIKLSRSIMIIAVI